MNASQRNTGLADRADYSPIESALSRRSLRVPDDMAGLRLDQVLAHLLPEFSRNRLQAWVRDGRVRIDGACAEPKRKLWGGEALDVELEAAAQDSAPQAQDIPLAVVFEDRHIIVVDKPPGLVVHPGSGNWQGTMLNALLHHAPRLAEVPRAGIVHRLDKDTSGLLVVAKTLETQTDLVRQLQARSVTRRYLALVRGRVAAEGTVDAAVGRHPVQRTRMAVVLGGRSARTHFRTVEHLSGATLVECALETGRTHQIRVHMAHLGHPLIGDAAYGVRRALDSAFGRQALHAWRLGLNHPDSRREMHWESPLPADFAGLLARLRSAEAVGD